MAERPWLKWYPADWRADPKLRACEPISRYVWMEMLGLMHEAEPYGHLILSGRAMDYRTLSRLIGVDLGEVKRAVKELEDRGVFSRTDGGVIFSRRMIRDEQKRKTRQENGSRGGSPILIEQRDRRCLDNHLDNQQDKPQRPEARDQILDADASREGARARPPPPLLLVADRGTTDEEGGHARRAKRKTRLAADWQPDCQDCDYAAARGHDGGWIGEQADAFRDYHAAKATTAADWHASWRTWVRHAEQFEERDRARSSRSAGPGRGGLAAVVGEILSDWRGG